MAEDNGLLDGTLDVVVVGGGIVGLATAWQVLQRHPGASVAVLEAESDVANHQTSHNSGVVHAGIYYAPGSLKAQLCARGRRLLADFCAAHQIPYERTGKLVVATSMGEMDRLAVLEKRARQNAVPDLRRFTAAEIKEVEPAANGVAALHSPETAVVDFELVAKTLSAELAKAGAVVATSWPVASVTTSHGVGVVTGSDGREVTARQVIVCAGLQADRLAGVAAPDVRVVPFRGSWFRLAGPIAGEIRGSIYPVPDPRFPFLGVHLTRRIDGQVWAGPNAFLAFSRTEYRPWAVTARDARDALTFPGLWRFALKYLGAAWRELGHDVSTHVYARSLQEYVPAVQPEALVRGPMGIRAQAMTTSGQLIDDFDVRKDGCVTHVINAPSPAATSALAIGEHLVDQLQVGL